MRYIPISKIPLVEVDEASPELAELYEMAQQVYGIPEIGVSQMGMGHSTVALRATVNIFSDFMQNTILPPPLLFMMHFAISTAKDCICCSAGFKTACRAVGVDEEMLAVLISDLDSVAPKRMQEIIRFAVKMAITPLDLVEADYDRVRDQGVSEQELIEIIFWTSFANFSDTLADSLKLVEPEKQTVIED